MDEIRLSNSLPATLHDLTKMALSAGLIAQGRTILMRKVTHEASTINDRVVKRKSGSIYI